MSVVPIVSSLVCARLLQHLEEPVLSFKLIDETAKPVLPSITGQKVPVRNSKKIHRRKKKWFYASVPLDSTVWPKRERAEQSSKQHSLGQTDPTATVAHTSSPNLFWTPQSKIQQQEKKAHHSDNDHLRKTWGVGSGWTWASTTCRRCQYVDGDANSGAFRTIRETSTWLRRGEDSVWECWMYASRQML